MLLQHQTCLQIQPPSSQAALVSFGAPPVSQLQSRKDVIGWDGAAVPPSGSREERSPRVWAVPFQQSSTETSKSQRLSSPAVLLLFYFTSCTGSASWHFHPSLSPVCTSVPFPQGFPNWFLPPFLDLQNGYSALNRVASVFENKCKALILLRTWFIDQRCQIRWLRNLQV